MRPPLRSRFDASRNPLNVPFRFTAIWLSNSESSLSASGASFMMPALFTSTSTPSNAASAASNMRRTAGPSPNSAWTARATADIGLDGQRPATFILDLARQGVGGRGVPGVVDDHREAVAGQPLGH